MSCFMNVWISDIEAQIRDLQARKKYHIEEKKERERVGLGESGFYDRDIYDGGGNKFEEYVLSIAANDEVEVSNATMVYYVCRHLIAVTCLSSRMWWIWWLEA
jgi:hypothetical protein